MLKCQELKVLLLGFTDKILPRKVDGRHCRIGKRILALDGRPSFGNGVGAVAVLGLES